MTLATTSSGTALPDATLVEQVIIAEAEDKALKKLHDDTKVSIFIDVF